MKTIDRTRFRLEKWRAIQLMADDGLSRSEMAEVLGCSKQSVYTSIWLMRKCGWDIPYIHQPDESLVELLMGKE